MILFNYVPDGINVALLPKTSEEAPVFSIDFAPGMGSGVTISSQLVAGVDSDNVVNTAIVDGDISVLNNIATIQLGTGGSGGTGPAANGSRFRVRSTITGSDARVLVFDTFVIVEDPSYNPD